MSKKLKKITAIVLCAISMIWGVACTHEDMPPTPPDYSQSKYKMDFYGYTGPTNGTWDMDGMVFDAGEDFRTVERYKEYKDSGMTILLPQASALYTGRVAWELSDTKMVFDRALEAGIDKIILTDSRIQDLSRARTSIIGEDKDFADEAALDAYITKCIEPYKDHEAFYGLMLMDEPSADQMKAVGEVYKSIKRVKPEIFVQCNLFPPMKDFEKLSDSGNNLREGYKRYIESFLDESGADYFMYDQYPMASNGIGSGYAGTQYLMGLQISGEISKERNVKFFNVTQTFAMKSGGQDIYRVITEDDAYYMTNLLLGFGVKQISYFTYWTKQSNSSVGEFFIDGASFITHEGEKTEIYYFMQKIHKEIQKFAPVIMNFTYNNSTSAMVSPTKYSNTHMMSLTDHELDKVTGIEINKEMVTVTELKDHNKEQYMYMVHNSVNPIYKGSTTYITTKLTFKDEYTHAVVYDKGEPSIVKLDKDNAITVKMHPGHAKYIMPYA